MSTVKLGIFGYGCVGKGLYDLVNQNPHLNLEVKKICIKNPHKKRDINHPELLTTEADKILNDKSIDVVVELIDDADEAFKIVSTALKSGKPVVSANKKMIAENLSTLLDLQKKYNTPLLYEGSCCAAIPIIRNLETYYDSDLLSSIEGIFNGTSNYILTKMVNEGLSFDVALKQAQELGFAESDPTLDIEGFDPKFKLSILIYHAFGARVNHENIFNLGITRINEADLEYAKSKGYSIKLVAKGKKEKDSIKAYCTPQFVKEEGELAGVNNEMNAVLVESPFQERQLFYGKGAGDVATGSAVLSDITALGKAYRYKSRYADEPTLELSNSNLVKVYVRYNKKVGVDINDFDLVEDSHSEGDSKVVVGVISLEKLNTVEWIRDERVSLITFN